MRITAKTSPGDCPHCLSGPFYEQGIIISVGRHFYLSLVHGGVTELHVALKSIKHIPNQTVLEQSEKEELDRWIACLYQVLADTNYPLICLEHYSSDNDHLAIQIIPVPQKERLGVKGVCEQVGAKYGLNWSMTMEGEDFVPLLTKEHYLWIKLPDGNQLVSCSIQKLPKLIDRQIISILWKNSALANIQGTIKAQLIEEKQAKIFRYKLDPYIFPQ